jgi:hypothetical protein
MSATVRLTCLQLFCYYCHTTVLLIDELILGKEVVRGVELRAANLPHTPHHHKVTYIHGTEAQWCRGNAPH